MFCSTSDGIQKIVLFAGSCPLCLCLPQPSTVSRRDLEAEVQVEEEEGDGFFWGDEDSSCSTRGCTSLVGPSGGGTCQCHPSCVLYGDCCDDYEDTCVHSHNVNHDNNQNATCDAAKCGTFSVHRSCQCDADCIAAGDCCENVSAVCGDMSADMQTRTAGLAATSALCSASGCSAYAAGRFCQCDLMCDVFHDCCADALATCHPY